MPRELCNPQIFNSSHAFNSMRRVFRQRSRSARDGQGIGKSGEEGTEKQWVVNSGQRTAFGGAGQFASQVFGTLT
jgi:hypothetical protein